MRRIKSGLLAFSIALACAIYGQAAAGDAGLSVGITSDCHVYGLEDRITVSVALKNQSRSPIVLFSKLGWGELGGIVLKVSRANGEMLHQQALDDDMIVPSALEKPEYYSTIFVNQFIGISRTELVSDLFKSPGKYKVWVEYMSPVPAANSLAKTNFWSMEKGRVTSRAMSIDVVEGEKCQSR